MSISHPHKYAVDVIKNPSKRHGDRRKPSVSSLKGEIEVAGNRSVRYESILEKSFLEICSIERKIYSIQAQPMTFSFLDRTVGKRREYTPDFHIEFERDVFSTWGVASQCFRNSVLIEVKPFERLLKDRRKLIPKFSAAQLWCEANGMDFMVISDRWLKSHWLQNAQLTIRARMMPANRVVRKRVLDTLDGGFGHSISTLKSHPSLKEFEVEKISVAVLQLIASGMVSTCLLDSFNNESMLYYEP